MKQKKLILFFLVVVSNQMQATKTSPNKPGQQENTSKNQQFNLKFFTYYAQIRREIFEFFLRIRSDSNNRMVLLNRTDRRKHIVSKYLLLRLETSTTTTTTTTSTTTDNSITLNFRYILDLVQLCLNKELDWPVLVRVLNDLPLVLQYEMNLVKDSEFLFTVFDHFHKRDINSLRNKPETLTKSDYICKFYPLIASLVLYHPILERSAQETLIRSLSDGISSYRFRFCLETLTVAIAEMHERNAKQCAEFLVKLSQCTATKDMAQPVLELLSTISDLKKLDSPIFGRKAFISVAVIAINYTDPLKFSPFIILLAHYVLCIWFVRCKQDFRKNYASFTCKGLYQQVIVQLDKLDKSSGKSVQLQQQQPGTGLKDAKSPSRLLTDAESGLRQDVTAKFSTHMSKEVDNGAVSGLQMSGKDIKAALTEPMKVKFLVFEQKTKLLKF